MKVILIDILLAIVRLARLDFRGLRPLMKWTRDGWVRTRVPHLAHGDRIWSEELQSEFVVVGTPSPLFLRGRWKVLTVTVAEWAELSAHGVDVAMLTHNTTPRNP